MPRRMPTMAPAALTGSIGCQAVGHWAAQSNREVCLAWTPDSLLDEPYVALQRASASTVFGTAPGHPVPVDLSASDMANGRRRWAVPRALC